MENQINDKTGILSIISAIKSDAFSRLVGLLALNVAKYYKTKKIRQTDAVILNEIAAGKNIHEINQTLQEMWHLSPERIRQLISITLRRASNLSLIPIIEKKIEETEEENRILKHNINILEKYIDEKKWENLPIKIEKENFNEIDFTVMPIRLRNRLLSLKMTCYQDILNLSLEDIMGIKHLGKRSIEHLKEHLISKGYKPNW